MRFFFYTAVIVVLVWFGWGFLNNKAKAADNGSSNNLVFTDRGSATSQNPIAPAPKAKDNGQQAEAKKADSTPLTPVKFTQIDGAIAANDATKLERFILLQAASKSNLQSFRDRVVKAVEIALAQKELERAALMLTKVLDLWTRDTSIQNGALQEWTRLDELHRQVMGRLLFNPGLAWRSRTYVVKRGDMMIKICRRFRKEGLRVEPGFVGAVNRLHNPSSIREGQRLRIPTGKMRVLVEKRSHTLKLFLDETLIRAYRVGLGKDGCTPETTFKVELKERDPVWYAKGKKIPHGHPKNPLGDFYIKLKSDNGYEGFGIHGTRESERNTIGTDSSEGCIRMYAPDIKELFDFLPNGVEVEIR